MKVVAMVALLFLAGCVDDAAPDTNTPSPTATTAPSRDNRTLEPLTAPVQRTLYLASGNALSAVVPDPSRMAVGTPASAAVSGIVPTIFQSPALPSAIFLPPQIARATIFLTTDQAMVSNGAFDAAVWIGSGEANVGFDFQTHAAAVAPGGVVRVDFEMDFSDRAGLVVPAGSHLELMVVGGITADASLVQLLLGGDAASEWNFTVQAYNIDPLAGITLESQPDLTGQIVGTQSFTSCDSLPGTSSQGHDLVVPPEAVLFTARLTGSGTAGVDIDMQLRDGQRIVAATATPLADEGIFLADAAMAGVAGKTLTLHVYACSGGQVTYNVATQFGLRPDTMAP